jgi:hypothetical protein
LLGPSPNLARAALLPTHSYVVTKVAQNSNGSAASPHGRPFPKGVSGNPGGRPKGLVHRIREETGDGAELVAYMLGVFRDEREPTRTRIEAATWLADRGYGKPTQPQALELLARDPEPLPEIRHENRFTLKDVAATLEVIANCTATP